MASKPQTKKRFNKPSINYHSTPQNIKPFDPDPGKFKPKNTPTKSENKLTTSQLASKLAGIWSYIGQSESFKSNETLNYGISHKEIERSSFENLKEMRKELLFSSRKSVPFPIVKNHTDEYIEAWYKRDIFNYKPKFVINTESKFIGHTNGHTSKSTKDHESLNTTISNPNFAEENTQKEGKLISENKISDQESESKIGFPNSNDISNTPKDLSNSPSCSINETIVDKSAEKDSSTIEEKISEDQNVISVKNRVQSAIFTNRHALAGAFAGSIVSLCLHPIDTIKTIIQSKSTKGNSFHGVLKCTLTERGFLGLYRGIASNIASSAPISAIYTFTYESVKGTLIPIFPKEYESLTHCISGGCSSIATSFVFTPSERIKQQMQIGTQYQNCWSALIGCVEKGGVASLYAGWGAVLCRNVPHSIIKFYTYERLKQFILAADSSSSPSSLQTLACGGLAGSTAALFTTPFDVVKTRIQTQRPGTVTKYNGVFHALKEITKKEGLQGLYRGLTPRLGMYVSQGSIFFASYEFLKSIFNLQIQNSASREIHNEDKIPMKMHK